jgi:hypothetical protein
MENVHVHSLTEIFCMILCSIGSVEFTNNLSYMQITAL